MERISTRRELFSVACRLFRSVFDDIFGDW